MIRHNTRWVPSKALRERLEACGVTAGVAATTAVGCISEWAMRHHIDNVAYDKGLFDDDHTLEPIVTYIEAALLQCRDQGLDLTMFFNNTQETEDNVE